MPCNGTEHLFMQGNVWRGGRPASRPHPRRCPYAAGSVVAGVTVRATLPTAARTSSVSPELALSVAVDGARLTDPFVSG